MSRFLIVIGFVAMRLPSLLIPVIQISVFVVLQSLKSHGISVYSQGRNGRLYLGWTGIIHFALLLGVRRGYIRVSWGGSVRLLSA